MPRVRRGFWKTFLTTQTGHFALLFLRITLLSLIFSSMQTFGEELDFCFDGTKEGHRLNSTVIKYVHAHTGPECVLLCMTEEKSCRSVNFRKTSGFDRNCELLEDVASERPELLFRNEEFDHYFLLDANRESPEPTSANTSSSRTQNLSKAKCNNTKLDLLFVVDGSRSVKSTNFAKMKKFIKKLNARFDIGAEKTQVALMQFAKPSKTKVEFNLGTNKTLEEVNQGVEKMKYLKSGGATTGDALRKSREEVFNGRGNDRSDALNVLLLFTDGEATDKEGKDYQVEQAKMLKDDGVKIITVGMGKSKKINKFRDKLHEMASRAGDDGAVLAFEADFEYLEAITNNLVEAACDDASVTK